MRSTFFVLFSILLHCFAVVALVTAPMDQIRDPAPKAGNTVAKTTNVAVVVEEKSESPVVAEKKVVKPAKKVVEHHRSRARHKTHKVKLATVLPPKKVVVTQVTDDSTADELDPTISDTDAQTTPQFIPVKETPPPGVEAASDAVTPDNQTEATSEDVQQTEDPAPVAIADSGMSNGQSARSYLDLKQMPGNKPPQYPLEARLERRQGNVELLYRVTADGHVADLQVVKSSGYRDLDEAAAKAIQKYRYVPGQAGWAKHPVAFALKGPATQLPSRISSFGAQNDADALN